VLDLLELIEQICWHLLVVGSCHLVELCDELLDLLVLFRLERVQVVAEKVDAVMDRVYRLPFSVIFTFELVRAELIQRESVGLIPQLRVVRGLGLEDAFPAQRLLLAVGSGVEARSLIAVGIVVTA